MPQTFPPQPATATPVSIDTKLPTYTSQFPPAPQPPFPPEAAPVGTQGLGFGSPRGPFPAGTTGIGLRPGMARAQGMAPQLRLPPNQLRLQLQQRLQGPQQVSTTFTFVARTLLLPAATSRLFFNFSPFSVSAPEQNGRHESISRRRPACKHGDTPGGSTTSDAVASEQPRLLNDSDSSHYMKLCFNVRSGANVKVS